MAANGILAVAILALGIAINTAVFAVVHAALFAGFAHVERSDRIVQIGTTRGFIRPQLLCRDALLQFF